MLTVSGFTQDGIPFVRITNSNPFLQIMSSAEIPIFICSLGVSISALMGRIKDNIKKNPTTGTIFLFIIMSKLISIFYFKYLESFCNRIKSLGLVEF
jgi:hypothetical protein